MSGKYDFDRIIDRRGTNSLKWDIPENEIPLWVADMDIPAAPEITEALRERLENGIFGYSVIPDSWYGSIVKWWEKRHGFHMEKEGLIFCTGVVPAISSAVRKLTTPGENVLIMTPVYNIFFNSIVNNGRNVLECPLDFDGEKYSVNFDLLEKGLSDPQTSMMILCNPHNPIGKIWSRDVLADIGRLAAEYHVTVISDEIHCDITDPGKSYIPFASVNDECKNNSVTCISPTKAFNLAGLQTAAVYVPDPFLRHKVWRGLNTDEAAEPNVFAVPAAEAAFSKGEQWLDELREYLFENKKTVSEFIGKNIPEIKLVPSEATYLLWLDCRSFCENSAELQEFLRKNYGVFLSEGRIYGKAGEGFLRLNTACPRKLLIEGLGRLQNGIKKYISREKFA